MCTSTSACPQVMPPRRAHATELVTLAPDVIFTSGSLAMGPMLETTRSVPIVFAIVPDPVWDASLRLG